VQTDIPIDVDWLKDIERISEVNIEVFSFHRPPRVRELPLDTGPTVQPVRSFLTSGTGIPEGIGTSVAVMSANAMPPVTYRRAGRDFGRLATKYPPVGDGRTGGCAQRRDWY